MENKEVIVKKIYKKIIPYSVREKIERSVKPEMRKASILRPCFKVTKSIFIHIPKNAGTSIAISLYGKDPWHHPIHEFIEQGVDIDKYFVFSVCRNPWDRAVSLYKYLKSEVSNGRAERYKTISKVKSFNEFANFWLDDMDIQSDYFLMPQVNYLKDGNGDAVKNISVFAFENISEEFVYISKNVLGYEKKLPILNRLSLPTSNNVYRGNDQLVEKIGDKYREDVDFFGYQVFSTLPMHRLKINL